MFISSILTTIFIVFATIFGEFNSSFKDWLKAVFYHHWIGKSILALVFFLILWAIFKKFDKLENLKLGWWALVAAIAGYLAILIFFVWHFLAG